MIRWLQCWWLCPWENLYAESEFPPMSHPGMLILCKRHMVWRASPIRYDKFVKEQRKVS